MYFHQNILQIIRICRVKSCEHFMCSRCQNSKYLNCTGIYVLVSSKQCSHKELYRTVRNCIRNAFWWYFNVEFSKISVTKSNVKTNYIPTGQSSLNFILCCRPSFIYEIVDNTMKFQSKLTGGLNFLGINCMVVSTVL